MIKREIHARLSGVFRDAGLTEIFLFVIFSFFIVEAEIILTSSTRVLCELAGERGRLRFTQRGGGNQTMKARLASSRRELMTMITRFVFVLEVEDRSIRRGKSAGSGLK